MGATPIPRFARWPHSLRSVLTGGAGSGYGIDMSIPPWLSLLIASAVILFACYRLYLAFAGPSDEERKTHRRGMLAMPRRQHGAIGVLYLLVASALIATSLGWNPFAQKKAAEPDSGKRDEKPGIVVE